jgi:hypothetical protein
VLCILSLLVITGPGTPIAPPNLEVDTSACESLDEDRVERLLAVEIATVIEAREPPRRFEVAVTCEAERVALRVSDPLTNKALERAIPAPESDDPERERTIALAAAQLFVASWLELTMASPPPEIAPIPAEPDEREAVQEQVSTTTEVRDRVRRHELAFLAGPRWRKLLQPTALGHFGIAYAGFIKPAWALFVRAGVEYGRAQRDVGSVRVIDVAGTAGVRWRSPPLGPMTFDLELGGGVVYQQLRGRSELAGVEEGVADGLGGEALGAFGLLFHSNRVRVGLYVEGGYLAVGPRGSVSSGDAVEVTGGMLGGSARVAFGL